MPSKTETAARRLVAEIHRATDGQPMRWCGLSETSQRAKTDTEAVHYAALKGWIDFSPKRDPHSVTLTDAGRDLPK
jgi:hypothetical protein